MSPKQDTCKITRFFLKLVMYGLMILSKEFHFISDKFRKAGLVEVGHNRFMPLSLFERGWTPVSFSFNVFHLAVLEKKVELSEGRQDKKYRPRVRMYECALLV